MAQYSVREFIHEAHQQISFFEAQKNKLAELSADHAKKIADLAQRFREVLNQITKTLLPEFSQSALFALSELIANPTLLSLFDSKEHEKTALTATISSIEKNKFYQQRDAFLNPETGIIIQQESELLPLYEKASSIVKICESTLRFAELLRRGYGTSSYPHTGFFRFFNSEFLQDWKYADIICEKLQVSSFTEALSLYRESKDRYETIGETLQDLTKQKNEITSLIESYDHAIEQLRSIDQRYDERIRMSVEIFITSNSKQKIAEVFQNNSILMEQYTCLDGLRHQTAYIEQVREKVESEIRQFDEKIHNLTIEKQRYENDMYRFRNKRWNTEQFSRKFNRNEDVYDRRLHKYRHTGDTIYSFNDYNIPSFIEEFLWWDIMTDGRLDGNFIPDVHEYYASHPSYHYERNSYSTDYGDNS